MSESEFPFEFARKPFHPTFLYRLPSDANLCYTFRMAGLTESKRNPFLCCSTCERVYAQCRKENKPRQHVIKRNFETTVMRDDPMLRHQPRLYTKAIEKLEMIETSTVGKKQKGFILTKLQKYVYSVIYRLPNDPNKCFRFNVVHKALTHLRLVCDSCIRFEKNSQAYLCTPTTFTSDPNVGHHKRCTPISYEDVIEENETITKAIAEKLMFERRPIVALKDDINLKTKQTTFFDNHSNVSQINVIEIRQKVQYIYRIPGNESKCYRFLTRVVRKSHIDLICSSCDLINRKLEQRKGNSDMSYKSNGYGMLEDPTRRHFSDCVPELYGKEIKGCILLDNKPNQNGDFLLERIMTSGARNLMYTLPSDNTKCYHFHFEKLTLVFCSPCYQSCRRKGTTHKTLYRFTGSKFLDDPELNHLPDCKPMLTIALLNKYQIVDKDEANELLKTISAQFEMNITSMRAPSEITNTTTNSEFPVQIIARKNTAISYLFRLPNDTDTCYRFTAQSINSSYSMQCATCVANQYRREEQALPKNQSCSVIARETDGFSMKLNPCSDHCDGCQPLSYREVLKTFRHLKTKLDHQNKFVQSPNKIDCSLTCIGCFNIWNVLKPGRDQTATYQCLLDGFVDDPRLNHFSGCEPLLYSDVMKKFDFAEAMQAENLFEHTVNTPMNGILHDISLKSKRNWKDRSKQELSGKSENINDDLEKNMTLKSRKTDDAIESAQKPEKLHDVMGAAERNEQEALKKRVEKPKGIRQFLRSAKKEITKTLVQGSVSHLDENVDDDVAQDHDSALLDAHKNIKTITTLAIENIPSQNGSVTVKSEIAEPIETKPILATARCKTENFSHTFDIPMFSEDEIEMRLEGRSIFIDCKRQITALGVTGCALSYSMILPDIVDVTTIETIWTAEELYLTARMHE